MRGLLEWQMPSGNVSETHADFERVEELKKAGLSQPDAIRQAASERGKQPNAVRINHYRYRRKPDGGTSAQSPSRATRVDVGDAVSRARLPLVEALAALEHESQAAMAERDAAQARCDEVLASVEARRAELEAKLKALS